MTRLACRGTRLVTSSMIVLALTLVASIALGAEPPALESRAAAIERASQAPDGDRIVAGHISRKLSVPVSALRLQRQQTGLGWGDILIANRIAKEAGAGVDAIVAELRGGKAWADIVRDRHVDLGKLMADVQDSQQAVEQRSEDHAPSASGTHTFSGAGPAGPGSATAPKGASGGTGIGIGGIGIGGAGSGGAGSGGIGRGYR